MQIEQKGLMELIQIGALDEGCFTASLLDCDSSKVLSIATMQGVTGICMSAIERLHSIDVEVFNTETKLQCYAICQQIEKQNQKVNQVLGKVGKALDENAIPFVLLKGQGLAQLYPNALRRQSGDIDIYVGTGDYESTKTLFAKKGWLVGGGKHEDVKHLSFSVDGIMIELHQYAAIIPGRKENEYLQQWLSAGLVNSPDGFSVDGRFVRTLPLVENLVYTFIHAFLHFIGSGLSLRQLVDVALLLKELNRCTDRASARKQLEESLRKTGYLRAWQVFGCVMVKYFGFSTDEVPCYNVQYEKKADIVIRIIFDEAEKRVGRSKLKVHVFEYLRVCLSHLRLFRHFPADCLKTLSRLLLNTGVKFQ